MSVAIEAGATPQTALRLMVAAFEAGGIANARGDARFLLMDALDLSATDLTLGRGEPLDSEHAAALAELVTRRLSGEPVARILGAWEFWGLPFRLAPATLVPRPDTETVVETALALAHLRDRGRPLRILDLGTGSGCILVALLSELPRAWGIGLDRSADALATARANAGANGVGARAAFLAADWSAPLTGPFDLIVSNPPYIATATVAELDPDVREHDPLLALDGGDDGLCAYRRILGDIAARPGLLAEDGALVLEIGYDQGAALRALARAFGFPQAELRHDLAGCDRVVMLRPPLDETSPITKVGR